MDFTLLVAANTVSTAGSSVFLIAILLWLRSATDNAVVLGALQFAALLPAALLAPVGGTLADRLPRTVVLSVVDAARGVLLVAAGVALLVGLRATVAFVLASAVLVGLGNAFFQPAVLALIPDVVPAGTLSRANGIRATATQAANVGGTALGGVLAALMGIGGIFVINGASFLIAAALEAAITAPDRPDSTDFTDSGGRTGPGVSGGFPDLLEGLRFLRNDGPSQRALFAYASLVILLPPVVLAVPFAVGSARSEVWVGAILATLLAGGVAGFLLHGTALRPPALRGEIAWGYGSMVASLLLFTGAAATGVAALFLPAALAGGAAVGWTYVASVGLLQRRSPPEVRSRVLAVGETVTGVVTPFMYLAAGFLLEAMRGAMPVLFLATAVLLLIALALLLR